MQAKKEHWQQPPCLQHQVHPQSSTPLAGHERPRTGLLCALAEAPATAVLPTPLAVAASLSLDAGVLCTPTGGTLVTAASWRRARARNEEHLEQTRHS
eukprot:9954291-Alexandrium_andersonii.AAC.1